VNEFVLFRCDGFPDCGDVSGTVHHNKLLQKFIYLCAALEYAFTGPQNYIGADKMDK
jgi:hypothetical protein